MTTVGRHISPGAGCSSAGPSEMRGCGGPGRFSAGGRPGDKIAAKRLSMPDLDPTCCWDLRLTAAPSAPLRAFYLRRPQVSCLSLCCKTSGASSMQKGSAVLLTSMKDPCPCHLLVPALPSTRAGLQCRSCLSSSISMPSMAVDRCLSCTERLQAPLELPNPRHPAARARLQLPVRHLVRHPEPGRGCCLAAATRRCHRLRSMARSREIMKLRRAGLNQ